MSSYVGAASLDPPHLSSSNTVDYNGPSLSLAEVAALTGVSRDTIKRRLRSGAFPNAYRGPGSGPGGPWRIPVTDVDASDLPTSDAQVEAEDLAAVRMKLAVAVAEIRLLRAHLADLQRVLARTGGIS